MFWDLTDVRPPFREIIKGAGVCMLTTKTANGDLHRSGSLDVPHSSRTADIL